MAKRIRFTVTDVASGSGWAVVMLQDTEAHCWVAAWDGPEEAGRYESDVTRSHGRA